MPPADEGALEAAPPDEPASSTAEAVAPAAGAASPPAEAASPTTEAASPTAEAASPLAEAASPPAEAPSPTAEAAESLPATVAVGLSADIAEFRFIAEESAPASDDSQEAPALTEPAEASAPVPVPVRAAPPPLLAIRAITRRFGAMTALDDVEFQLQRGEVLALLGDNGSGKTTLLHILAGRDQADSGEVMALTSSGALEPLRPGSAPAAIAAGIGMVDAGETLAADLTALENIVLGTQSLWRWRLSRHAARRKVAGLMQRLDMTVALDVPVAQLSGGDRLCVKILRALHAEPRLLLLDEPTQALTPREAEVLIETIKRLAADGIGVIVTTRKADEAFMTGGNVVILRNGRKIADLPPTDGRGAIDAQMWAEAPRKSAPSFHATGDLILELQNIDVIAQEPRASLHRVSLEVRSSEIVGIAGLAGEGLDTLAELIAGLIPPAGGNMRLFDRRLARFDAAAFVRAGVGWIPRDRQRHGAIAEMSIAENLVLEDIDRTWFNRYGLLRFGTIQQHAREIIADHVLDCPQPELPVSSLSAGTIDKLVLARALDRKLRLFVANQPTRGLDVATAADVHRRIEVEREAGAAVVLISEDVDELLVNADAISVLHEGSLSVPQPTGAFDRKTLGLMMGGHGSLAQDWHGWGDSA